jgi:prepilin-type N-terminal cleavage/methylation domain-containing protein
MQRKTYKIQNASDAPPAAALSGFTLAELLITLAVTAMLLTAVAVALNASVISYRQNEDIFNSINSARQALFRITTQLRTAEAVATDDPANQCTLLIGNPPSTSSITYKYDSSDNKLYLITNDDLSDDDYLLCDNVTGMTFTRQTVTEDELTYVKSVQISITVARGNVQKTLSAAVVVRRNLQ